MPEISIVLPAYNVEKYIDECIESLLNQTFMDFEIIIINDGSKDKTLDKAINWSQKDTRIKLVSNENQGAGFSRNYGLKKAIGNYVIFIDPDDTCREDMLETLYSIIIEFNADIALCDYYEVRNSNELKLCEVNVRNLEKLSISEDSSIIYKINPQPWNKLIKRELLEKNKIWFPTKYRREDLFVMCCSVLKANSIVRINEPMYYYKVMRPGGATHTNLNTIFDVLKNLELINKYYIENKVYNLYFEELEMVSIKYGISWYGVAISRCKFKDINRIALEYRNYFRKYFGDLRGNKYLSSVEAKWGGGQKFANNLLIRSIGSFKCGVFILFFLFRAKYLLKR